MKGKILSILSICRKAGAIKLGFDPVVGSLGKNAKLVVFASDVSPKTKEQVCFRAERSQTRTITLLASSDEVFAGIGKKVVVMAVTDRGLADKVASLSDEYEEE